MQRMHRNQRALVLFIFSLMGFGVQAFAQSQSFDAAREQMLNGHRDEALVILNGIYLSKRDPKAKALIESYSGQFINQEGEALYFQGVHLIGLRQWLQAKEKLDQANLKEPNHVLILMRLSQVEWALSKMEVAEDLIRLALKQNPFHKESTIFSALMKAEAGETKEALRMLEQFKPLLIESPILFYSYLKILKAAARSSDIEQLKKKALALQKMNPLHWIALEHFAELTAEQKKSSKSVLEKCAKERERCKDQIEQEVKRTQFLWIPEDLKVLLK